MALANARPVVAGSANCLIVDDEPSVRRSLARMLQAQGFKCFEAGSGVEGLEVLDHIGETPLILSDMRMPELDGMGFLEAVRPLTDLKASDPSLEVRQAAAVALKKLAPR